MIRLQNPIYPAVWKVWIKLILMLMLAVLPLVLVNAWMNRESLLVILDLDEKLSPIKVYDSHLVLLKRMSRMPNVSKEEVAQFKTEFDEVLDLKVSRGDLTVIRKELTHSILVQTLQNLSVVLVAFLLISFLIARTIVETMKGLIKENISYTQRLEKLNSLESWQRIARMLVHEIRTPLTPIKLISSDIQTKFKELSADHFRDYLAEGISLIQAQLGLIERLTEQFTKFAKLPEPNKESFLISEFADEISKSFPQFETVGADFRTDLRHVLRSDLAADQDLLRMALLNLIRNAQEANPKSTMTIELKIIQNSHSPLKTSFQVRNSGETIPDHIASKLFEMSVSSKASSENCHFGLGLIISRKIALDHGGDLNLICNDRKQGVVFELEIPEV